MKFTVLTPTFNRAHTLKRVYESLLEQTEKDFEWLVIDDGSTDCTCNLISHYRKCARFPINYHAMRPNRGKHIAHNKGIELAQGELIAIVDSDDALRPQALERCWYWWQQADQATHCGVDGLCVDQHGSVVGDRFPSSPWSVGWSERQFRYRVRGEHWGVVRTSILREFPFPELSGFVPEGVVWAPMGKKYLTLCVNEVFRIYYC